MEIHTMLVENILPFYHIYISEDSAVVDISTAAAPQLQEALRNRTATAAKFYFLLRNRTATARGTPQPHRTAVNFHFLLRNHTAIELQARGCKCGITFIIWCFELDIY